MNEGKDDYQLRLELLRARAEAARLATRLRQAEWDAGTANEESRTLRESIAFGIGRSVIEALRSPRNLMALPFRIAGLARRARRARQARQGTASEAVSTSAPARNEPTQFHAGTAAPCTEPARLEAADDKPAALAGLRVAGVLDVFSADSFAPDCQLTLLRADTWAEQMRIARPHLLLVESCWHGPDRTWEGLVSRPSDALRALVGACREAGIPTAFWNKEDPLHYEAFVESAKLFDCVLTTDADCIPKYRHDLGHGRIYLMPFALQPKVFHPINAGKRSDDFFFAGAYYPHLVERSNDFRSVVDTLGLVAPVHIYDRNHGLASANGLTYPAAYRRMLRGGVAYAGIADLYRSYSSGININTIKQSPTMFARRVFELIGCGCGVYGNYSTGIANLFGELVVASDDQEELLHQAWRALRVEGGDLEYRRVGALRKALTEHTYAHRLAYLAGKTGFALEVPELPRLVVLARPDSIEELDSVLASFGRQSIVPDMLLLDVPEHLRAHAPAGAVVLSKDKLSIPLHDRLPGAWVAPMCPEDYYGEHYLADLLLATRYSGAAAIGKAAYRRAGREDVENAGLEYRQVERLALRRMIMATQTWSGSVGELLDTLRTGELRHASAISIDHLNYVEGGGAATQVQQPVFHEGIAMADALAFAESMEEWVPPSPDMAFDATRLADAFHGGVIPDGTSVAIKRGRVELCAKLPPQVEATLQTRPVAEAELVRKGRLRVCVDAAPDPAIGYAIEALAADGGLLKRWSLPARVSVSHQPPEGAVAYRLSIRVQGIFTRYIDSLRLDGAKPAPLFLPGRNRLLVVTNIYPRHDRPYRNGFVHRRVLEYRRRGVAVDVVCVSSDAETSSYQYDGVQVHVCAPDVLRETLKLSTPKAIAVHFLDRNIWEGIRDAAHRVNTVVWLHGAEVQSWTHRAFNFTTDAERDRARDESASRTEFWRSILSDPPQGLRLVFVSRVFAEQTWRDLGVDFPGERWHVIHNPIDVNLFAHVEKPEAMRNRILSVRPHDSRIYANDLVAEVIRTLSAHPEFSSLSFHLVGDGELFEENFRGLDQFSNVLIEKRLIRQEEIAALHREYGVFLVPTRGDTQGVSRDEAMASGLVPVTNRVGAVEEFADEEVAILAAGEDVAGMVDGIRQLVADPARFGRMSRAAAARVRAQSAASKICGEELEILGLRANSRPCMNPSAKNSE